MKAYDGLPKDHFNGKSRSKGRRKGKCLGCNKFGHYAGTHHLMMITIIPGTSSMIRGMTGNVGHQGNNRLFKEGKEPQL